MWSTGASKQAITWPITYIYICTYAHVLNIVLLCNFGELLSVFVAQKNSFSTKQIQLDPIEMQFQRTDGVACTNFSQRWEKKQLLQARKYIYT